MESLTELRVEIDAVDEQIINLLAVRARIAQRIAAVKHAEGIPVRLPERIAVVLERCGGMAATRGLDPEYIRGLYMQIIEETCRIEEALLAGQRMS